MNLLVVVERPAEWPLQLPEVEVVSARDYLTNPRFADQKRTKVFNLCRDYAYQSFGYYVSLLAEARGHKPLPSAMTLQDLKQASLVRIASEEVEAILQSALAPLKSDEFTLTVYFGRNVAKRYDRLAQALFEYFPTPFLRAEFTRAETWRLRSLRAISAKDIPEGHREFVIQQARRFFERPRISDPKRYRYDLAILTDPTEPNPPSNARALERFSKAAKQLGIRPWLIGREDFTRIAEFDALFIRATTSVNHFTYRFARRAEAEGLVVIDDPSSILRCCNKVYQAEIFERHEIPCPKTIVVSRDQNQGWVGHLGFPCVLKRPDSSFSTGVVKAEDEFELEEQLKAFFRSSELVVAQEFIGSAFDWRVGVLDGNPLFVCRYHMARGHWQIQKNEGKQPSYGKVETLSVQDAPQDVVALAVRAASLVGDGLYGVDIKQTQTGLFVMEINDNPNLEAGAEDSVSGDALYEQIARTFLERIEKRGRHAGAHE